MENGYLKPGRAIQGIIESGKIDRGEITVKGLRVLLPEEYRNLKATKILASLIRLADTKGIIDTTEDGRFWTKGDAPRRSMPINQTMPSHYVGQFVIAWGTLVNTVAMAEGGKVLLHVLTDEAPRIVTKGQEVTFTLQR